MPHPSLARGGSVAPRSFAASLLCAIGFALVAWLVGDGKIDRFDLALIAFVQGLESPLMTAVMKGFTWLGTGGPVIIATVVVAWVLYAALGFRKELLLLFAAGSGSFLLNIGLKLLFRRERPSLHRIAEAVGYSFPSGHSMAAFSLYGLLVYLLWKHACGGWQKGLLLSVGALLILSVGTSRIYLGVHYPSDVVAGYLASCCWVSVAVWGYERIAERRRSARRYGLNVHPGGQPTDYPG